MKSGIHVSLDIGTTSVKVIVAEYINGELNVIGVGNEKSQGISRGIIVDIDRTVQSIQRAIQQAEEKSGVEIEEVIVGVPANGLEIEPCHGMVGVSDAGNEITSKDVEDAVGAALIKAVPPERDILAVLPQEFIVDGFDGISDPRGMIGVRLELHALLLSAPKTILHSIRRCVEKAGCRIKALVLQPLGVSSAALSSGERDFGTIVIDMGGGQTTASVIHDHQLKFSFVDQEGGEYMTKDISVVLNTAPENAERIKREYGYALVDSASKENQFLVDVVGQSKAVPVSESYLSEIIEARLLQIFETIDEELRLIDAYKLPGGIILTGGVSAMPGVTELAEEIFGVPVKMSIPEQMGIRYPSFTTAIGLIQYTAGQSEIQKLIDQVLLGYNSSLVLTPADNDEIPVHISESDYQEQKPQTNAIEKGKTVFGKLMNQLNSFFE